MRAGTEQPVVQEEYAHSVLFAVLRVRVDAPGRSSGASWFTGCANSVCSLEGAAQHLLFLTDVGLPF